MSTQPLFKPSVTVASSAEAASALVARCIAECLKCNPATVLGLATGRTQLGVYSALVQNIRAEQINLRDASSFNLDEYVGLAPYHPSSFRAYMRRHFFDHIPFKAARAFLLDGTSGNPAQICQQYEERLRTFGPISLQLLGLGINGHIGFNEPGSAFDSRTRVVALSESTRLANQADFPDGESVPLQALSMGIGTILEAQRIILLATGSHKANALVAMITTSPDPGCPASALRYHPGVEIVCDREAARLIEA